MKYNEFSVVSRDGHHVRLREIWSDKRESDIPPHFLALGAAEDHPVEPLPDGRFRIGVRLYSRIPDARPLPRRSNGQ
jgi:hypothetical protein